MSFMKDDKIDNLLKFLDKTNITVEMIKDHLINLSILP